MSWFRVDDKAAFHRKVLRAGNEAFGAFCRAGSVSSGEGTDGRVTIETCEAIAPKKVWDKLVDAGLAERIAGSTDLQIHDYLQWNPSAAEVDEAREAKRQAGAKGGRTKALNRDRGLAGASGLPSADLAPARAGGLAGALGNSSIIPSQPIPTQPVEELESARDPHEPTPNAGADSPQGAQPQAEGQGGLFEGVGAGMVGGESPKAQEDPKACQQTGIRSDRKRPATRQPDQAAVTDWLLRWGIPPVNDSSWGSEVQRFLDFHASKDSRFVDWGAAWRTWKHKAAEFGRGPGRPPPMRPVQRSPGYQQTEERKRAEFLAENARKQQELGIVPDEFGQVF